MSQQAPTPGVPYPLTQDFLARVRTLQDEMGIRPGRGSERDRTRIAQAVTDAFLCTDGSPDGWTPRRIARRLADASILVWQLFTALAGLGLECPEVPGEGRCAEDWKLKGWDPLKMPPRPPEHFLAPCGIVKTILAILTEDPNHGRSAELERVHHQREFNQSPGRHTQRALGLAGPRAALHPGGPATLLPRAVGGRLARPAGEVA